MDAQEIFKEREKKRERKRRGRGAEKNKREEFRTLQSIPEK